MRYQWEEDDWMNDDKPAEEGFLEFIIPMLAAEAAKGAISPPAAARPAGASVDATGGVVRPTPAQGGGGGGLDPMGVAAIIAAARGNDRGGGSSGDPVSGAMLGSLAARGLTPEGRSTTLPALGTIGTPGVSEPRLEAMARDAARTVDARISPQLRRVQDMLDYSQTQAEATSEHRSILGRDAFRGQVLDRLQQIQQRVDSGATVSPTAQARIQRAIRVTLG